MPFVLRASNNISGRRYFVSGVVTDKKLSVDISEPHPGLGIIFGEVVSGRMAREEGEAMIARSARWVSFQDLIYEAAVYEDSSALKCGSDPPLFVVNFDSLGGLGFISEEHFARAIGRLLEQHAVEEIVSPDGYGAVVNVGLRSIRTDVFNAEMGMVCHIIATAQVGFDFNQNSEGSAIELRGDFAS